MGKGAIDDRSHLSLMAVGLQARDHVLSGFDRADLVICVGYDLVEYAPAVAGTPTARKRIIHIDTQPAEVDAALPAGGRARSATSTGRCAGCSRRSCRTGSAAATPGSATRPSEILVHADLRTALLAELEADAASDAWPITPQRAIADLRRALGPDDIVVSATSAPTRSGSPGCTRPTSRTP